MERLQLSTNTIRSSGKYLLQKSVLGRYDESLVKRWYEDNPDFLYKLKPHEVLGYNVLMEAENRRREEGKRQARRDNRENRESKERRPTIRMRDPVVPKFTIPEEETLEAYTESFLARRQLKERMDGLLSHRQLELSKSPRKVMQAPRQRRLEPVFEQELRKDRLPQVRVKGLK